MVCAGVLGREEDGHAEVWEESSEPEDEPVHRHRSSVSWGGMGMSLAGAR